MASNPLYNHSLVNLYRSIGSQMGFSPAFQNASAAQGISESSLNPNAVGDSGASFGLHQWNRKASPDRYNSLVALSQKMNLPPTDPRVQITHWYNENAANKGITDPRAANDAALASERPSGWKPGDPTGVPSYGKRLGDTMALLRLAQGQQPSAWQATGTDEQANAAQPNNGTPIAADAGEGERPLNNIGSTLANIGSIVSGLGGNRNAALTLGTANAANDLQRAESERIKEDQPQLVGFNADKTQMIFKKGNQFISRETPPGFGGADETDQVKTLRAISTDPELMKAYNATHGGAATLSTEAIKNAAARIKNGEKGVLTRMSQGNAAAIAEEVAAQTGEDPTQILQNQINATGKSAEARTIGTSVGKSSVSAGTFASGVKNALEASSSVPRGEFVPLNKLDQMVAANMSDQNLLDFKAAHETLIREYGKAISPTGNPTVSDMNHARELLSTATSKDAYEKVVKRLQREVEYKQNNLEKLNSHDGSSEKPSSSAQQKRLKYNPQTGELE